MRRVIIPYHPHLKDRARALRKNMTPGEKLLWTRLSGKRMGGFDFDRQRPVAEFIVDFYCKDLRLAVELDGWSHALKGKRDEERQRRLESRGVRFLRFTEQEVVAGVQLVADQIEMWIRLETAGEPTPYPSKEGNRTGSPPTEGSGVGSGSFAPATGRGR